MHVVEARFCRWSGAVMEAVRLVGRARKLIRAGTIKNPDGDEGSGRLGTPGAEEGRMKS
jgi:hypothetical protein